MPEVRKSGGLIFDLDGTLLDTLQDLATAANVVLARHGWPGHPLAAYRFFIGDGLTKLAERVLPAAVRQPETIREIAAALRQEYHRRCLATTRPYPGILPMLSELQQLGSALAVLSNKPDDLTRLLVDHFLPEIHFQVIQGAREGVPLKPDPAAALGIAQALQLPPERLMLVGDSANDLLTARRAGMIPVGVLWGFRPEAELRAAGACHLVATPADLVRLAATELLA